MTTQLRNEMRAAAAAYRTQPAAIKLLSSFAAARTAVLSDRAHGCMEYLEPFLETIRLEETSGVVTQRALSAVRAFLHANLITMDEDSGPRGMAAVVRAATYCRFEVRIAPTPPFKRLPAPPNSPHRACSIMPGDGSGCRRGRADGYPAAARRLR